jgi:hypothetical protein
LISFPIADHANIGDLEIALGPEALTDEARAAYLGRFVALPAEMSMCIEPVVAQQ